MESYQNSGRRPIMTEDVFAGTPDGVYLSPVRRHFCLLVTFDFLFTILLWSVCIILMQGDQSLPDAFIKQMTQYSFRYSSFDIVMCSFARFVILLLFYALLSINHWIVVATTTAGTSGFFLTKIFLFEWSSMDNATYLVMLVLASFIISWSEAWFLDYRVVPQEIQSALFHSRLGSQDPTLPWLRHAAGSISRHSVIGQSYPESLANFYSPLESPEPSGGESSETESVERNNEAKLWIQQGPGLVTELIEKINGPGWILDRSSEAGDHAFSMKGNRHLFMFSGTLPVPADAVITELLFNFEKMPDWNPHVTQCAILQRLDHYTDVTYQVSKEGAGGVISPRDFVTLRHYRAPVDPNSILPNMADHIIATTSVKHFDKPKMKKIIRGTNGAGGWVLSSRNNPLLTDYHWVLDIDLQVQGWVPRRIVDPSIISAGLDTLRALRLKLSILHPTGTEEDI